MLNFTCLNLLVSDLQRSREFYTEVFGAEPISGSPHYAAWKLPSGIGFGLVQAGISASAELVFETDEPDKLPEAFTELQERGLPPGDRRFGRTLLLADLKNHRLRLEQCERTRNDATRQSKRAFVA